MNQIYNNINKKAKAYYTGIMDDRFFHYLKSP